MNRFPCHFFSVFDQAGSAAGNGAFLVFRLTCHVGVDAAGEIKNRLKRSGNFGADFDAGHGRLWRSDNYSSELWSPPTADFRPMAA